jgi:5-methylcytosine-specific restriction endonuclease McrA
VRVTSRTRNLGTQTESQYWGTIRSALRNAFRYWRPGREALRLARISRGLYRCAACGGEFSCKQIEVDHVVKVGSLRCLDDLSGFVERLTPESPGAFQALCKECHAAKTKRERSVAACDK